MDSEACIICLTTGNTIRYKGTCSCSPVIHTGCIDTWFRGQPSTCPICRKKYVLPQEEYQNPDGLYCCLCIFTFIPVILVLMFL